MAAFLGQGASFTWNSGGVGQILSMDGPNVERAMIDATNLSTSQTIDSSTVRYRTFAAGYADGGEFSMELQFDHDDSGQGEMWDDFESGTSRACTVSFSDGDNYTFTGFIRSMSFSQAIDEVNRANVTIKITGGVDHTSG